MLVRSQDELIAKWLGLNYERTHPDRCYRDAAAAEADGLRKSAR